MRNYTILPVLIILSIFSIGGVWMTQKPFEKPSREQYIFSYANNTLTDFQKDMVKQFREGNIPALAAYFGEKVSLTLLNESDFYTKAEGEKILLDFCQNHVVKKFLVKHFGENKDRTNYYLVGEMTTTTNEKYRVFISNNEKEIEDIEITIPRNL